MVSHGMALCSVFAAATIAQGGVQVQLVPTPNLALYPPNSVVQVDVRLIQTGGSDQNLRMIEFDTQATNSLLAIAMPLTHNRGTPAPGDDIHFCHFGSRPNCASTPSTCGSDHYIESHLSAGPVDTRVNVLSMAFHALSPNPNQIVLPGGGSPVTVGKLTVTLPSNSGSYTLDLMNAGDMDSNRGARVDFGFDPHTTWRARDAAPNNLIGGTLTFVVCSGPPCEQWCGILLDGWTSVLAHSPNQSVPISLIIPDTGLFSEPRGGISKIVVSFDAPLNPATVIPANVTVCGNDVNDSPVDLSGIVVTTATTNGNTKMEINFTPALPNYAKYRIALKSSIQGANGGSIGEGAACLSRILTGLQGDYTNDRRINATDLGGIRNLVGTNPINPASVIDIRADANNSGNINATDVGLVRARVGQDARAISDPICP